MRICLVTKDAFQRYDALRKSLARAINDAHTASSDFLQDLIIADAPISIAHVDFVEHLLQSLRCLGFDIEAAKEHAMQAKATSYQRC
jgi:hypothetical protein